VDTSAHWRELRVSGRSLAVVLNLFIFSICLTIWLPISIAVGGLNLRASQLLLPIVLGLLATTPPRLEVSLWSLLTAAGGVVWWLSLVCWTVVNGPQFGHPLGRVLLMALNLAQGVAVYVLIVRVGDARAPIRALLWSVTLLNAMLVVVTAAASFGVPVPERWLAPEAAPLYVNGEIVAGTVQRFIGTGVMTGCISASAAVLAICLWFDPAWRHRWLLAVSGIAGLVGMVIGFSRQSVLSLVLGLIVAAPFLLSRGHVVRAFKLAAIGSVLTTVAILLILATAPGRQFWYAFIGRTAQFFDPQAYRSGTAASRADIWTGMLSDIARNPLVGQGQDSYLRYMDPWEEGAHNFPMEVIHSTGLLGFAGYLMMHGLAPVLAIVMLAGRRFDEATRVPLIAVLGAYAAIVAASITNIIYWNPTYWLLVALMIAAVRLADRRPSSFAALHVQ
jgi:O-antigen ligase